MKVTLNIKGMSCGGCVHNVQQALARLPLISAKVGVGHADVEYDETGVTHQQIVQTIEAAGYEVMTDAHNMIDHHHS
ncbi:MAG: cation transporter [bacterium]|nr:cation transporter [bacterium]